MSKKPQLLQATTEWLTGVIAIAKKAGEAVLRYQDAAAEVLQVIYKEDHTPLTAADLKAQEILQSELKRLTPSIPIISEESALPTFAERSQWNRYWLLDPLDGTRGFLENLDEFTVNIALIEEHRPVLGVVYAPELGCCYYAAKQCGAFKQMFDGPAHSIHVRTMDWQHFHVLLGHYLHSPRWPQLLETIPGCHVVRLNSSLKFCAIAEGQGDIYPRFGDTSEWDVAAAQCVLEEAGGVVVDFQGEALQYNTRDSLVNPAFVALGTPTEKNKIIRWIQQKRREM